MDAIDTNPMDISDTMELFQRLGVALAIGLLIGIERGWKERDGEAGSRTAGIRTFTLIALLGGVAGALVPVAGEWPLALIGVGFTLVFAAYKWRECEANESYSVTSVVVAILTYLLGAYALLGNVMAAVATGVVTAGLLAARSTLHDFVRKLTWEELRSGIVLAAMTFLFLPVLPNEPIDPWGLVNPYELWMLILLIAVVSFMGYAAVKIMGEDKGLLAAAAAGGIVSSTAVTLNFSRLAKKAKGSKGAGGTGKLQGAICMAWATSFVRIAVIAIALNTQLLLPLGLPTLAITAVLCAAAWLFFRQEGTASKASVMNVKNPFELRSVLLFGLSLAALIALADALTQAYGGAGLMALAAVAGAFSPGAISLSAARLSGGAVDLDYGALVILVASFSNLVVRCVITFTAGNARFFLWLGVAVLIASSAGVAVWFAFSGLTAGN